MSSERHNQTLADYVALAISPGLIMGLVASLVFFLINVLYVGDYVERMCWILFFFVFGAVLIARMTMLDDTSSRAALYGVPLGFLTWLGMQMFVEYPRESGMRELSFLLNAGLIALVWWCAHRLTWDCTNIDEQTDVNAEGLLQAAGLDNETEATPEEEAEKLDASQSWWQRWQRYREKRNKKRTLGVWVVYFSLAALPLFGLGQALIAAEDVERRRTSFWLMIVYVGCGLGLLLTTCFLSLRRYLRQRRLQMPAAMTGVWLSAGGLLIAALLLLGAVLPRPDAEYALFSLTPAKAPKRDASKYALKGGRPGQGAGRPGADDPQEKQNDTDSGGEEGQQKGERGAATKQGQKGGPGGKQGQSRQGDNSQGQNNGQAQNNDQGQNNSQGQNAENGRQNQNQGESRSERDRSANGERQPEGETSRQPDGKSSNSQSATGRSLDLRETIGRLARVLKWIVFILLGLAVLFFIFRSGLQYLANFTEWARRLLEALRNFWANLFGGRRQTVEEEVASETSEEILRERPFASFPNPFTSGRRGLAAAELIRYTFAAVQAWARERDLGRQPGETPLEFAERIGAEVPALEKDLRRLALLYARAAYARGGVPADSVDVLRQFWERLEAVADQSLSA